MSFGCIFVPDFSLEAILRAEPELRSQAVVVLQGKPPLQKIVALNEAAWKAGLRTGMTKLQAEVAGGVVLRSRSAEQESAAHQALVDCAQSFSPRVEDRAADTLWLDLAGLEKLFGSLPKIVHAISRRASAVGLTANVAVASSLESAGLAAHGFRGVTVVPPGEEAEFLGGLPVTVLFADEADRGKAQQFEETFRSWGIGKLRDFAALPAAALSERLGREGVELQQKALGRGRQTLAPSDAPLVFEEMLELEYPLVLLEPLAFVLNRMLERLCARLEARALAARELSIELRLENGRLDPAHKGGFRRSIRLPVPLVDGKTFLKLLQLDLKAHPPGSPIRKILLRIEPSSPRPGQNGLFLPCFPEPEKLELTLARLSAVLGEGRAGSPQLLNTHRREAFEMQHFSPPLEKDDPGHDAGDLVTALRIFRPAIPVAVACRAGQPAHVASKKRCRQVEGDVLWATGPWRSSGDWWAQDGWVRDEWDIAVEENIGIVLYRLVHDLVAGEWRLEGSYD
ncbi:MAG: DNA polymerase Y family protein [Acidobacteria bacterium]|nr:DNA polymerase Y family protein [Acidobacteriota bacterium]